MQIPQKILRHFDAAPRKMGESIEEWALKLLTLQAMTNTSTVLLLILNQRSYD
jgi:hypothetical protein